MAAISHQAPAGKALRGFLRRRLRRLEHDLAAAEDKGVHAARKLIKLLRSLMRLVKPALGKEEFRTCDGLLRLAGDELAPARRAEALAEAAEKVIEAAPKGCDEACLAVLREAASRAATFAGDGEELRRRIAHATEIVGELRGRIDRWQLPKHDVDLYASAVAQSHGRARRLLRRGCADRDPAVLHEGRKSVIHLRYQLQFIEPLWSSLLKTWSADLQGLRDLLGDVNDIEELEHALQQTEADDADQAAVDAARALLAARREALLREIEPLSERLFAEKRKSVEGRIAALWRAFEKQNAEGGAPEEGEQSTGR